MHLILARRLIDRLKQKVVSTCSVGVGVGVGVEGLGIGYKATNALEEYAKVLLFELS